jgi:hypothetical protein
MYPFAVRAAAPPACLDDFAHWSPKNSNAASQKAPNALRAPKLADLKAYGVKAFGNAAPGLLAKSPNFKDKGTFHLKARVKHRAGDLPKEIDPTAYTHLIVKFADDAIESVNGGAPIFSVRENTHNSVAEENARAKQFGQSRGVFARFPEFALPSVPEAQDEWSQAMRFCAALNSGDDHADLSSYYSFPITKENAERALDFAKAMQRLPEIEVVYLKQNAVTPSVGARDIPSASCPWCGKHFGPAPLGTDQRYAWGFPGGKGEGMKYADLEYAWTITHEDFPKAPLLSLPPTPFTVNPHPHGTGAVSIVSAPHNGVGIDGGAPVASVRLIHGNETEGTFGGFNNRRDSVVWLISGILARGDVLLMEVSYPGDPLHICSESSPVEAVFPMSAMPDWFDVFKILSGNGIIVVETGANFGVNLDASCLGRRFDRTFRDSGSVLVGGFVGGNGYTGCGTTGPAANAWAGTGFSNFGSRFDAAAWASCIVAANGAANTPTENESYGTNYGGTSGAGPIITSAILSLQGIQKARNGRVFNPFQIRSLIKNFGTPSADVLRNVGWQPDMKKTIDWMLADYDGDGVQNGTELSLQTTLIDNFFSKIFGRSSSWADKFFWQSEVERMRRYGADPREVYRAISKNFFNAPEYLARNRTNAQFIEDLYQTYFQRSADPIGFAHWLEQLALGFPRDTIIQGFMYSAEFDIFMNQHLTPNYHRADIALVLDVYRAAFHRLPDDIGLPGWLSPLRTNCTNAPQQAANARAFLRGVFNSQEYSSLGRTNQQFLGDMYDAVLRRYPEIGGWNAWLAIINSGASRSSIIDGIVDSQEFAIRTDGIYAQGCI